MLCQKHGLIKKPSIKPKLYELSTFNFITDTIPQLEAKSITAFNAVGGGIAFKSHNWKLKGISYKVESSKLKVK